MSIGGIQNIIYFVFGFMQLKSKFFFEEIFHYHFLADFLKSSSHSCLESWKKFHFFVIFWILVYGRLVFVHWFFLCKTLFFYSFCFIMLFLNYTINGNCNLMNKQHCNFFFKNSQCEMGGSVFLIALYFFRALDETDFFRLFLF